MAKKQNVNIETGEVTEQEIPADKLNKIIETRTRRPNGTLRITHSYENCVSMTEQHSAHLTHIPSLMQKYTPDELTAYIMARNANRTEIVGHDFSIEPNLQEAKNAHYALKKMHSELPDELRKLYPRLVDFLKFIDNPENQEKMIKMGLMTKKQIANITTNDPNEQKNTGEQKQTTTDPLLKNTPV